MATSQTRRIDEVISRQILAWFSEYVQFEDLPNDDSIPFPPVPFVVGVSGPQGVGKTTLTTALPGQLPNLNILTLSIDDFYLTYEEQLALSERFKENPLLDGRGLPGTHDLCLAVQTFNNIFAKHKEALASSTRGNAHHEELLLPQYDKSLHNGRGDRLPPDQWLRAKVPVHVIVLEGWCLGFQPLPEQALAELHDGVRAHSQSVVDEFCAVGATPLPSCFDFKAAMQPALESLAGYPLSFVSTINAAFADFHQMHNLSSAFIHLLPTSLSLIYSWRLEQEHATRRHSGGNGMADDQVQRFVDRFMPGYVFMAGLVKNGFFPRSQPESIRREVEGREMRVLLDERRTIVDWVVF
ncbi:hypothetical protein HDU85_007332 [Gaertneriomyces sp. JEL0708]|nr:hypothetical protein HDU85_007332 [Gaertneriomyces sp. JEL0708]